jgi:peptide/nickel transport system permease protein
MWNYVARRLLYNVPVLLGIILLLMFLLRKAGADPAYAYLGKNATPERIEEVRAQLGLDQPFLEQYGTFLGRLLTADLTQESWSKQGLTVGEMLSSAIVPTLMITVPALLLSALVSISIALVSAFTRGRLPDRLMMVTAVIGMSVSFLVYIILGQYFGAYKLREWIGREVFAIEGFEASIAGWFKFCCLPVMISVVVSMGYDTRFYRAVMVEESSRDYITTARAKGAGRRKIMFVHMLKNAMIPIITRVMTTLPFLIMGSVLLEYFFNIPGMGNRLLSAINDRDLPVIETFTAMFAIVIIVSNILTDVLYALVDPRVRLQ